MLRWCQSTIRILDGRGSGRPSTIRFHTTAFARQTRDPRVLHIISASTTNKEFVGSACATLAPAETSVVAEQPKPAPARDSDVVTNLLQIQPLHSSQKHSMFRSSARSSQSTKKICLPDSRAVCPETEPLTILTTFLTPSNTPGRTHLQLTRDALFGHYIKVRDETHLHLLTATQLTALLSLMGTLSLASPKSTCIYHSDLVLYINEPSAATDNWAIVLEITREKERLGYALGNQDRYWAMRAWIAKAGDITEAEGISAGKAWRHAVAQATAQYLAIRQASANPEVHIPAVQHLCRIFDVYPNPDRSFAELFWKIVLKYGHKLPTTLQSHILDMLSNRLSKPAYRVADIRDPSMSSSNTGLNRPAIGTRQLSIAFGAAIFPCYNPMYPASFVTRWAMLQARQVFASSLPLCLRWTSLSLLAVYNMPHIPLRRGQATEVYPDTESTTLQWRTILVLASLERTVVDLISASGSVINVKGIIRPLWRAWKAGHQPNPVDIDRAVLAAFLRIASITLDGPLADGCYRYCMEHSLFVSRSDNTASMKKQALDLMVAYTQASIAYSGTRWMLIFENLRHAFVDIETRQAFIDAVLEHYARHDVKLAYAFYLFVKDLELVNSVSAVHAMSVSMAAARQWNALPDFLTDNRFSSHQREELLGSILRVFQIERSESVNPTLVSTLGQVLWELYSIQSPPVHLKYPIRYFFSIMIRVKPAKALDVIERIYQHTPSFFTTRLCLRLVQAFLRRRQFTLAVRMFHLLSSQGSPSKAKNDVHRKLILGLTAAGARKLASDVSRSRSHSGGRRSLRLAIARSVKFRHYAAPRALAIRIIPAFRSGKARGQDVIYAVTLLINARRALAARKLFERTFEGLDPKTRTTVGNIILHGPIRRFDQRNGRLVRHVLRTRDFLVKKYKFVPDRTTVNILLKALLKWRNIIQLANVKKLFDHMIRNGYPAQARWRREHGVPFGSPPSSSSEALNLSSLPSHISFHQHVRPMYKMFIKAFFLRRDVLAARKVVGILKEEEALAMMERQKRNQARRLGIIKKRRRLATSKDVNKKT
ncbi:hypothetical protein BDQ12DRAFT_734164 [Crucibulum laeve]|uniref:Uncharacterized protein n=1 Tax=Crucibulum laeve TaxID=68775 RepID=A0A5C3M8G6_9AGAR|nr:hypothetical protein BDQ12DRAFT_734164 [Crucibulum laeve]